MRRFSTAPFSRSGESLAELSRRTWLAATAASGAVVACSSSGLAANRAPRIPKVAGVVTIYHKNSHADVLIGKILQGWKQDGGTGPALELASLYVEQVNPNDLSRELSKKHGFPIVDSIEQAITLGTDRVAVDGVLSIGEHGSYPRNDLGQTLYPRRRFFDAIADVFEKRGSVVPVFNDKHLAATWTDAKAMYDRAQKLKIPFLAGSSMPVGFRVPDIAAPMGAKLKSAVAVSYSGLDIYGVHSLEFLQANIERRAGGETGVRSLQCRQGAAAWKAIDEGEVDRATLDAAIAVVPHDLKAMRESRDIALLTCEHVDGFRSALLMCVAETRGTSAAWTTVDDARPVVTMFEERTEPVYPHFAYLLKAIERMVHTGQPSYPVERTLLSTGLVDRAFHSRANGGEKLDTPELEIAYKPVDWPHAPHIDLMASPTGE